MRQVSVPGRSRGLGGTRNAMSMLRHDLVSLTARRDLYRAKLVFYVFLISLGVFFTASLVSYVVIRLNAFRHPWLYPHIPWKLPGTFWINTGFLPSQFRYLPLTLPATFWVSTGFLVLVSWMLQRAVYHARRNHVILQTRALLLAGVFAAAFVALQFEGLRELLRFSWLHDGPMTKSFKICFTLALLHALHVLGGVAFLGFLIFQSSRNRYDHERHWPIDNCASYWHFLDAVWIIMLMTFMWAR